MSDLLYLDDKILEDLNIETREIVDEIEKTVIGIQKGTVSVARKTGVTTPDNRYLMATLAASDDSGLLVVKSVLANKRNKDQNLPVVNGGLLLLDSETGELRAVLDAQWLTAVRTAGLSAMVARKFANADSHSIGLIGAGVQAESHLRAFSALFPLSKVYLHGRGETGMQRVKAVAKQLGLTAERGDPQSCLSKPDIVVSTVSRDLSMQPFLDAHWLSAGAFVAMPDLGIPWRTDSFDVFGKLIIDDIEQERTMEQPMVPLELVTGELADVLELNSPPMSRNPFTAQNPGSERPTGFIFRGIAAGDLAVASLAYRCATGNN